MIHKYLNRDDNDEDEKKIFKLVGDDIKRTLPECKLFRHPKI